MSTEKLKKKEISERISLAISRSGKRSKDIAEALGVSEVTMSKYVNGVSTPKNDYLITLAQALNVSVSWLLTGEDGGMDDECAKWKARALKAEKKLSEMKNLVGKLGDLTKDLTTIVSE